LVVELRIILRSGRRAEDNFKIDVVVELNIILRSGRRAEDNIKIWS
jgi:hypothetical protein